MCSISPEMSYTASLRGSDEQSIGGFDVWFTFVNNNISDGLHLSSKNLQAHGIDCPAK